MWGVKEGVWRFTLKRGDLSRRGGRGGMIWPQAKGALAFVHCQSLCHLGVAWHEQRLSEQRQTMNVHERDCREWVELSNCKDGKNVRDS
jgi:hypothetical protein